MRLIGSIKDKQHAQEFSYYLLKEGVENTFEPGREEDQEVYFIWIVDEDDVDQATREYDEFVAHPENPKYHGHHREARRIEEAKLEKLREQRAADEEVKRRATAGRRGIGILTIVLVVVCGLALFWQHVKYIPIKDGGGQGLIVVNEPYSVLLFDFPRALQLAEKLTNQYPENEIEDPQLLPQAGKELLREALDTPYWEGAYHLLVAWLSPDVAYQPYEGDMFVKIGEGEVWRLFTPALLHLDFLYLLFNVLWLWVLGSQIETRIGVWRYALLIVVAGIITNVCQYLMSGPVFMGLSGVVCALFGFIWMRQLRAPWEGYQLQRLVILFITIFIVAMFLIQLVSFGLEIAGKGPIGLPIANTAHIIGLLLGALLGRFDLFAYHAVRTR